MQTFNLRRTNAPKTDTSSQSTANSNVVAILEKANAIRQVSIVLMPCLMLVFAFLGLFFRSLLISSMYQAVASDEGGDDDNWSDI